MSEQTAIAPAPPELPRLRIHHLLTLTTISSILMASQMGLLRLYSSGQGVEMSEIGNGLSVVFVAALFTSSVCIAIVLFGLAWRNRGIAFPSQPGHWVSLYLVLAYATDLVCTASFLVQQLDIVIVPELISWVMIPVNLIFCCLMLALWIFAYRSESARIWKWGWAAMALRSIYFVLLFLYIVAARCINWISEVFWYRQLNWQPYLLLNSLFGPSSGMWILLLTNYACAAFFFAAIISDFRNDRRRHWSHWMVLMSVFMSSVAQIPYYHWALVEYF